MKRRAIFSLALIAFIANAACRSKNANDAAAGLIVVKAPATGEVRRVLVSEGAAVTEGAAIIEIAVKPDAPVAADDRADDQARARNQVGAAQKEIADAEAEANRAAVEVQRVEPLVRSGAAPQAQLDAARAVYQQAQERLARARDRAASAQIGASIPQQNRSAPPVQENVIAVRVPQSGTVRVLATRVGQRVAAGQTIATLSSNNR